MGRDPEGGKVAATGGVGRKLNGAWGLLWRRGFTRARHGQSCTHDASVVFYETARVENDTGDRGAIHIGPHSHVRGELLVFGGRGRIRIGSYCYVGEQTRVWAAESIWIGDRVLISHCVSIMDNATHPVHRWDRHRQFKQIVTTGHPVDMDLREAPVTLEDDVLVGCNSVILRGVTVGRGAIVGAGSVVTKDVAPFTVVAGNPARVIRTLSAEERGDWLDTDLMPATPGGGREHGGVVPDVPALRSVFPSRDGEDWYGPVFIGPSTIAARAARSDTVRAVRKVLEALSEDAYMVYLKRYLDEGLRRFEAQWRYLDIMTVLHAAASLIRPRRYLEIGVRRGRSLAMVASVVPDVAVVGFDLWIDGYAGMENPGPDFVRKEIGGISINAGLRLIDGDSHKTVPRFFSEHPDATFDLMTVDGDHSDAGALRDLRDVLPNLSLGGAIVFDDIAHPAHPGLRSVWRKAIGEDGGLDPHEFTELGYGVAFAVRTRPPTTARRRRWLGRR